VCPASGSDPAVAPASTVSSSTNDVKSQLVRYHWQLEDATDKNGRRIKTLFVRPANDTPTLTLANATGDKLVFAGEPTAETRYGGPGERMFLEVAAHAKPCSHPLIPGMQCLQVRELKYDDKGLKVGTPGEFGNFYDSIDGYTHEDGVRNVLRVERYTIENPPADGSRYAYVLDMVVESENTRR
jgi:hypothetical protein